MRYGFPSLSNIRSLDDYVLSYDTRNRIPHWVFEHLTEQNVAKNESVDRAKSDFHEDLSIHEYFRYLFPIYETLLSFEVECETAHYYE